jgi:hypothetical protein
MELGKVFMELGKVFMELGKVFMELGILANGDVRTARMMNLMG